VSLVELGRYSSAPAAHIVRGRLEAEGIDAVCFDTGMNAIEGVPQAFPVRVMVLDDDLARARNLIRQTVAPADEAAPWRPDERWLKRRRRAYLAIGAIVAPWLVWLLLAIAG
jgi:hypothetical protein